MDWNYDDPATKDRDKVRFLVGDTCASDPLVSDQEVAFAIGEQPTLELAAAFILRSLAARYSRKATSRVGDISNNCSDIAKAFSDRADKLDPGNQIGGSSLLVAPSFGGLSISEKQTLDEDADAVQPSFRKGMNDIPGGPSDSVTSNTEIDDPDWI